MTKIITAICIWIIRKALRSEIFQEELAENLCGTCSLEDFIREQIATELERHNDSECHMSEREVSEMIGYGISNLDARSIDRIDDAVLAVLEDTNVAELRGFDEAVGELIEEKLGEQMIQEPSPELSSDDLTTIFLLFVLLSSAFKPEGEDK